MFLEDSSFLSFSVLYALGFLMGNFLLELFSRFILVGSNFSVLVNGSKCDFGHAPFLSHYQVNPETQKGEGYLFPPLDVTIVDEFPSFLLPLDSPVPCPPSAGLRGSHDGHH